MCSKYVNLTALVGAGLHRKPHAQEPSVKGWPRMRAEFPTSVLTTERQPMVAPHACGVSLNYTVGVFVSAVFGGPACVRSFFAFYS